MGSIYFIQKKYLRKYLQTCATLLVILSSVNLWIFYGSVNACVYVQRSTIMAWANQFLTKSSLEYDR